MKIKNPSRGCGAKLIEDGRIRCGHHCRFTALHCLSGRPGEQPTQMRKAALDVSEVGADEALRVDDGVVDRDLKALADQPLCQLDIRALTQVVGVHLEAQAKHGDLAVRAGDQPVDNVGDH
jgi:hypothetical protein